MCISSLHIHKFLVSNLLRSNSTLRERMIVVDFKQACFKTRFFPKIRQELLYHHCLPADMRTKKKVCVLGASVVEEIFGSAIEAYGSVIYIDDRLYVVNGVLESMGTVASGISPDDSIFIPYATGVKYLVGSSVRPTITVLAADVNNVEGVIEEVTAVLCHQLSERRVHI